jgi:ribulose-phosphate 3-epimerase
VATNTVAVVPSLLAGDLSRLGEQLDQIKDAGCHWLSVDVMDGHFVPNITIGPVITEGARRSTKLPLDVHLMIAEPEKYLEAFAKAGADLLTVHQEVCPDLPRTVARIHALGVKAGVAVNPATPLDTVRHVLRDLDLLLVMSVNPGFGGQSYIPMSTEKVRRARQMLDEVGSQAELEVDGGIDAGNAGLIVSMGATVVVAGSAVYRHPGGAGEGVRAIRRAGEAFST